MATAISPSPGSSPGVDLPPIIDISPPSPPPPSQPDQKRDSLASSTPPSQSPPAPSTASPPSPPQSPPPALPTTSSMPPPSSAPPPTSPPPTPPASSPPPPTTVASPPPSLPNAPPPAVTTSPPPPSVSPPPPVSSSPPPEASLTTPVAGPPPPQAVSASPPANVPTPPSANSPPSPTVNSPAVPQVNSHPPSSLPAQNSPPPVSAVPSPPLPVSTSSPPPVTSAPAPPDYLSANGSTSTAPLPSMPTEKPFARATNLNNVSSNSNSNRNGLLTGGAIAIGLVVGLLILCAAMAVWFVNKKKRSKANSRYKIPSPFASSQKSESTFLRPYFHSPLRGSSSDKVINYSPSEPGGVSNSRSWFTYDELIQATNGFSSCNLLGEGGFGSVYKGILVDGREVAVKQLKIGSSQGEREFRAEVEIISRVHHRHLVSLVGYCISQQQRLLVYDYVPNNTLHYHLHTEGGPVMGWTIRVKAAAGAARGIAYLHEDCYPRIIHRDIKSSNILLDSNFEARVSDFGLAKLTLELDSNTHVTTRVMGTFGYMAPEYATSGKLTEKSDVYSFGVVLLELITGRKPVDASQPLGDESLVEWARPLLTEALDNEDFDDLVDLRLEKNYDPREMVRMIEAAAACVRHSATKRPRMSQVVRALDELSDLSNGMKPGQSEIYNSREQSAQIRMFQRMAFGSQDYSSDFFNHSQSSWSRSGSRDDRDRSSIIP